MEMLSASSKLSIIVPGFLTNTLTLLIVAGGSWGKEGGEGRSRGKSHVWTNFNIHFTYLGI